MAEVKEATENAAEEQTNGSTESNGGTGRTALRAAAIAAASGATAIAAKKALSARSDSDDQDDEEKGEGRSRKPSAGGDVLTTALSSGWDSARDSVVPMLGHAAVQAGEYVARSAPELVRDTIVPQFIRGFERARKSSDDDE
jgi:hypothetical protein